MKSCPYNRRDFEAIISKLQSVVDEMQVRGFSNVSIWVRDLDRRVEVVVCDRLRSAIDSWVESFLLPASSSTVGQSSHVVFDQTIHEILLANQMLYLSPSLEQARIEWIATFHDFVAVVTTLPRMVVSRFAVFAEVESGPKTYANALKMLDVPTLRRPYVAIENMLSSARFYVQQWLQYQALWDASTADVADRIGRNIDKWKQLLVEIKSARSSIDSVDEERAFGRVVINHRQVINIDN